MNNLSYLAVVILIGTAAYYALIFTGNNSVIKASHIYASQTQCILAEKSGCRGHLAYIYTKEE